MDARIPLSVVLHASGRKHETVPSRTYTAPVDSPFFRYLRSDDTRLPRHALLQNYIEPAENYNTYVGEDEWARDGNNNNSNNSNSDAEASSEEDAPPAPPPRADEVVEWVSSVLAEPWAQDGVVLCGRYAVADDCAWAVASRASRLSTVREVFVAMRGSNKFFRDVKCQLESAHAGPAEFTIAKAVSAEESKELRAFVPYLVTVPLCASSSSPCAENGEQGGGAALRTEVGPPLYAYAGVTQRVTEACFPSLMQWSEEEHDVVFRRVVERVKAANLVERTLERDPAWCDRLVARFDRHNRHTHPHQHASSSSDAARTATTQRKLWLFLSVDVLFDSLQLPIYLLSAKAKLFAPSTLAQHVEVGSADAIPFIDEPKEEVTSASHAAAARSPEHGEQLGESNGDDDDDADEEEDWEEAREAADVRSFLRLFRDEYNWNQYTQLLQHRIHTHDAGGETSLAPPLRYFCAVASEASDLVTCGDTLTKRGLALEFSRPELLTGNPQAMQHMQEFLQQQQEP